MAEMQLDKFLSDAEKQKIGVFVKDRVMFEAVKKVLLAGIYYNGTLLPDAESDPTRNYALSLAFRDEISDEHLGHVLRATAEGTRMVEMGFEELPKYAPELREKKDKTNPAL